ncbi:site-specific integrase, partial [Patescibacteria group bacterium]|nr:site-specific integrase [Patescibacteria group bacterium]
MADTTIALASTIEDFITYLEGKNRAKATVVAYRKDLEQLVSYLANQNILYLEAIKPEHIEGFKEDLAEQKYTAKSISRKLNAIKSFFRFTEEKGLLKQNPASTVAHPKYEIKAPRILSQMEYRAIRDASREDVRISTIVELLLQTGMRIGELARLELDDINQDQLIVSSYESH